MRLKKDTALDIYFIMISILSVLDAWCSVVVPFIIVRLYGAITID